MIYSQFKNSVSKLCVLVAATLICQISAYADRDDGKGDRNNKDEHGWVNHDGDRHLDRNTPVVPEANAGWVLIPFFGVVLLFSARQYLRAKA